MTFYGTAALLLLLRKHGLSELNAGEFMNDFA